MFDRFLNTPLPIFKPILRAFKAVKNGTLSLRKKCPYLEFFWSIFSRIRTEYGERYLVSLRIQSESGKIRTRKSPNTDTFHAVFVFTINELSIHE